MVEAAVQGFKKSSVLCTLKHFPGHGDTSGDSHTGAVYTYKTLDELRAEELLPFQAGIDAGADLVMVGHICTPSITDSSTPATLSSIIVTDILRDELGFQGVVITDAMNMSAITNFYNSGEAAVKAVQAGVDVILMPANLNDSIQALTNAVENGTITEKRIDESVMRILSVKLEHGIIDAG
jgi:beta-N-acetylhexosaminidase